MCMMIWLELHSHASIAEATLGHPKEACLKSITHLAFVKSLVACVVEHVAISCMIVVFANRAGVSTRR